MKTTAISFVAFCAAVISATAQTNPPISTRTINLTAEQYHVIKENVLKDAPANVSVGVVPDQNWRACSGDGNSEGLSV